MCDDNVIPNRPSIKKHEVQKKLIKNSIPKNIKTETKKNWLRGSAVLLRQQKKTQQTL